jgi:hypothetical protein
MKNWRDTVLKGRMRRMTLDSRLGFTVLRSARLRASISSVRRMVTLRVRDNAL